MYWTFPLVDRRPHVNKSKPYNLYCPSYSQFTVMAVWSHDGCGCVWLAVWDYLEYPASIHISSTGMLSGKTHHASCPYSMMPLLHKCPYSLCYPQPPSHISWSEQKVSVRCEHFSLHKPKWSQQGDVFTGPTKLDPELTWTKPEPCLPSS